MIVRFLLCCTFFATFMLSAAAQEPDPGHGTQTLSTGTQLVILDATVYDKQHNIVTTPLTREDFAVTEDKIPQDIRYFETEGDHQAAAAKGDAPLLIAVLDELNFPYNPVASNIVNLMNQTNDYAYERAELLKWVKAQPPQLHGPMEILALTHHGYIVVQQTTRDRDKLADRLAHRDPGLGSPFRDYLEETGGGSGMSPDYTLTKDTLQALWGLGLQERSEPGRKILLWMGYGGRHLDTNPVDVRHHHVGLSPFELSVRRIRNLLVDARITLDVFTPGIAGASQAQGTVGYSSQGSLDHTLSAYTSDLGFSGYIKLTGGFAVAGNDIQGELAETANQSTRFYTLSYTPKAHIDDASFRSVRVTVNGHPDWTVVTRSGYYAFGQRDPRDVQKEVLTDMALATYEPMPFSNIDLRLTDVQRLPSTPGDKSAPLARFTLQADSDDLQWTTDPTTGARHADINLSAAAFGTKPDALASRVGEWKLSAHAEGNAHIRTEVAIVVPIPPKTNRLRFVMRDVANGRLGTLEVRSAVLENAPLYTPPPPALQGHPPPVTPSAQQR
jgi:VWFA-related protein